MLKKMFDTLFSEGSDCDSATKTDIAAWWFCEGYKVFQNVLIANRTMLCMCDLECVV